MHMGAGRLPDAGTPDLRRRFLITESEGTMINRWNLVALIVVVIAGWGAVTVGSRAQEIEDDYSIHTVKGVLEQPAGFSPSFLEKQTNRLGDRASIAVLKIFDPEELTKPENVRKILPL